MQYLQSFKIINSLFDCLGLNMGNIGKPLAPGIVLPDPQHKDFPIDTTQPDTKEQEPFEVPA